MTPTDIGNSHFEFLFLLQKISGVELSSLFEQCVLHCLPIYAFSGKEYGTHLEFRACNFIDQGLLPVKRNWMFPSFPATVGHSTALNEVLYLPYPSM